ncbi:hypothetical protein P3T73_10450 [Kiritimatiellota bacterium B12222]|nr:hypothetical protein P3T73_10450 [Kiritimatiellota bacterium B12222]
MARPYRLKFENACYLVTLSGVDGLGLFVEKEDAEHFVNLLELIALKQQILLHAYALGANSATLVVETPRANLSLFLQGVQTAFARHIRQHYVQSGSIMKDRYRAKVLDKGTALAAACEYVHSYPVLDLESPLTPAAQVTFLKETAFSSLAFTLGESETGITHPTELLRSYGSPVKKRAEKHLAACEALLADEAVSWTAFMKKSPIAIGSEAFIEEMEQKHKAILAGKKVKGFRQYGKKVQGISRNKVVEEVAKVFGVSKQDFFVQRHASILRPVISNFLYQYSAMTQKEIATYLGLGSAAAVSLQIKRLLTLRKADEELNKKCIKLEKAFARS